MGIVSIGPSKRNKLASVRGGVAPEPEETLEESYWLQGSASQYYQEQEPAPRSRSPQREPAEQWPEEESAQQWPHEATPARQAGSRRRSEDEAGAQQWWEELPAQWQDDTAPQEHSKPPQQGYPDPAPRRPQPASQARYREDAPRRAEPLRPLSRQQAAARRAPEPDPRRSQELGPRAAPRRQESTLEQPVDIFDSALESVKKALYAAGIFSLFSNILTLAGPIYMLQVYDRVLTSGSIPTLVALSVLLVVLYGALALLEMLRGQILNRIAGRIDTQLGPATLEALPRHRLATGKAVADEPLRDLATLRSFISGSGPATFFDLPWAPIFFLIICLMHWSLGILTLLGMAVMVGIAVANEVGTRTLTLEGRKAMEKANKLALESGRNMEATVAMGMMDPIVTRWQIAQQRADAAMRKAGDRSAAYSSASKVFRMFMQSVLLAAGALLVIEQQISSGMMIAVSIIGGKALGPLGGAVSGWRGLIGARDAYDRLKNFHKRYPVEPKRLSLPAPKGRIEVRNLTVTPPGSELPILKDISLTLDAGQALGVIGASAAGKSTLARALIGLWPPDRGSVRLDGADLRMWNRDELGPKVGYLPQMIELFDGTVAQNISRFYPNASSESIFRAAEKVGIHDMIVDLPDGYNFKVGENGSRLSAGQRQRLGLARAVFGDPVLVILDEPNANLDVHGEAALHRALKALKTINTTVIMITHRPSALDVVDHILVLDKGEVRAFGEKSKVLQVLQRHGEKNKKAVAAIAQQKGAAKASIPLTALPKQEEKKEA
jgi:ATP-binding cassette subfamily C protein EexD